MKSKLLLITAAIYLIAAGLGMTFLPQEIFSFFESKLDLFSTLIIQVLGAVYIGFGVINWMLKDGRMGRDHNRPIILVNFLHFFVSLFAIINLYGGVAIEKLDVLILVIILYSMFTIGFGYLVNTKSIPTEEKH